MIAGLVPAVGFATVRGDGVLVVVLPPETIVATVDRYLGLVILPDAGAVGDDDVVVDVDGDVEDAGGPHAAEFAGEVGPTGISASDGVGGRQVQHDFAAAWPVGEVAVEGGCLIGGDSFAASACRWE